MPNWVTEQGARFIHLELMAEHGGLMGPSREGSLEAVLARPQNLYNYAPENATLERLAAAYGFALCRGHCFPDGNKRLGLAVMDVFLRMNGSQLMASEAETAITLRAVAAGEISEEELAIWIRENSGPFGE